MKKQQGSGIRLIPVSINGTLVKIDPSSIGREKRTIHHGEFKGMQVNSPETYQIGESVVLWPEAGKPFAVAMSKAALGVLSTEFLKSEGFTVKAA